jgi:transcriptional regulator with XRE-family HTH domain
VRRVPGLRREELAMLAGISPNYYLRLEQGRDQRPSVEVIDALARALQLDGDATAFIHSLAQPTPARRATGQIERAPASIQQLINAWPNTPAFVHNHHLDVLAANPLSLALCPAFSPGANCLRAVFLDPEMRNYYGDWDTVAQSAVARLRGLVGKSVDDPHLRALVAELTDHSPDFKRLWARQDIQLTPPRVQVFNHQLVGRIELKPERLAIVGTNGQLLIVRHAEPGSTSARALERLADIATRDVGK